MKEYKKQTGFSIVELLVAIAFISVIVVTISTISNFNNKVLKINEERTQTLLYGIEAAEAVKLLDWDDLIANDYYLELNANQWELLPGSELIDNRYTRTITIEDVYRENISNGHAYDQIVSSGGNIDPDTKKVIVTIDWESKSGLDKQEILEFYLHRWESDRWSQSDWAGGAGQETWADATRFSAKTSGMDISMEGVVTLKSGFLDWNNGTTTDAYNISGGSTVQDIYQVGDYAYMVTNNYSSGSEFYVFDVSDIYDVQLLDNMNISASVTGVKVDGDYAFLSSKSDNRELQVIDISNPYDIDRVAEYNISGNRNGRDVAVDGTEVYIVRRDDLSSFSILDPEDPQFLDIIDIDDYAIAMHLSEDYIFVVTEEDDKELQVFDITNPANLDQIGEYDLPGDLDATDIYVQGNRAYIGVENNPSGDELFILDISDPQTPSFLGGYEISSTIYSVSIIGPYAIIGTGDSNEELLVLDVSFPATINKAGGFDLDGFLYASQSNCSVVYGASSNTNQELLLFSTEDLDCGYSNTGNLVSSTYDTGDDQLVYNWISWSGTQPLDTTIRFQIATSNNPAGPWNFVGPDGSNSTYYDNASHNFINYSHHQNQRYLRYKVFLDTSSDLQVPVLEEVNISYSIYP
jgi:type II secretory pathway pseudopilin PulG